MAEEIEYEQLDQTAAPSVGGAVAIERVSDIPVELTVEIGSTQATVGEALTLAVGAIVTLETLAGDPVHLLANGTPIARGEVVVVGDKLGLRVKEIIDAETGEDTTSNGHGPQAAAQGADAPEPSAGQATDGEPAAAHETLAA